MDGLTVRPLGKGCFAPVASPDQGEPSCPPVEPPEQEPSRPCTLDQGTALNPPKEISFSLGTHDRCSAAASTKEPSCPLET